jgi:hypothetical protein
VPAVELAGDLEEDFDGSSPAKSAPQAAQ